MYRIHSEPEALSGIANLIAAALPPDIEVIIGVETGGIGLAAALALRTGLPWSIARRSKGEVDVQAVVGAPVASRTAVLVKDAALGGGSLAPIARSTCAISGAFVTTIAVGLSSRPDLTTALKNEGYTSAIALTIDDLRATW